MSPKSQMRAMSAGSFAPKKGNKPGAYVPELRIVVEQRLTRKQTNVAGHNLTEAEALNLAKACLEYVTRCKEARTQYRALLKQN